MCIILAKYFPSIGWAGAKNRDRKYIPTLDFIEDEVDGIQRMMMHDQITGYKEGLNNHGVSILNTSLDIGNDEADVENGKIKSSPDGKYIEEALLHKDPLDAVKHLIHRKLVGCTIVFNEDNCYLIEASDQDGTKPYKFLIKKINKNNTVSRTNHGIYLPWASFQRNSKNKQEVADRLSSESRLKQAEKVVQLAQSPEDLVDGMCKIFIKHPQLNIMRFSTGKNQFRTTSQQLCVPKEKTLYCRPVSSNLQFDFWKLNKPNTNVWVEILNNRELWQKTNKPKPFEKMQMSNHNES